MPQEPDDSQRFDDKVWLDLFEPLSYGGDTTVADRAAKLLDYLLIEIESGSKGAIHAATCIENALRLIFPFTSLGRACMILFQVSLGKDFPAQSDTLDTLTEAMKRTKAALERGPVRRVKHRRKQSPRK